MKLLFTLLSVSAALASCSPSTPKLTSDQEAVTAYLKKSLDDPASYQPVNWGKVQVWRQKDEARALVPAERLQLAADSLDAKSRGNSYRDNLRFAKLYPTFKGSVAPSKAKWERSVFKADSMRKRIDSLLAVNDTTQLGRLITHTFRAKNKMGALVLDSVRFEVQQGGQVRVWNRFKE